MWIRFKKLLYVHFKIKAMIFTHNGQIEKLSEHDFDSQAVMPLSISIKRHLFT